ncbi:MAG: carboxylating nicotinate-nucleotide diphosphorylase [Thermodesulfobacteriota bacterium]
MEELNINWDKVDLILENSLIEDLGSGDVTTNAIFSPDQRCEAYVVAKQKGIVSGVEVAKRIFTKLDPNSSFTQNLNDGNIVEPGWEILRIHASVRAVLSGERLALNLLQRMSGIATQTSKYVDALKGFNTEILDTRKTVPGLRVLDKYAVACGGGQNHRFGLYDLVMIKDNHIKAAGGIENALELVRSKYAGKYKIEVETSNLNEVGQALKSGADIIMLDNMSTDIMKEAVILIDGKAFTEASGGITLKGLSKIAETGVDFISVGALTHSVQALDISLYMV